MKTSFETYILHSVLLILSSLSIYTSFLFLQNSLSVALPYYYTICLGLSVALSVEVLKRFYLNKFSRLFLLKNAWNWMLTSILVILISISLILSLNGFRSADPSHNQNFNPELRNELEFNQNQHEEKSQQIKHLTATITDARNTTYKNTITQNAQRIIENSTATLAKLLEQQTIITSKIEENNKYLNSQRIAKSKNTLRDNFWIYILIEVLIIFGVFYITPNGQPTTQIIAKEESTKHKVKAIQTRECVECKCEIKDKRRDAKYCSAKCRMERYRKKRA